MLLGADHDGFCQGMLGILLQGGGKLQQFFFGDALRREQVRDPGLPGGYGTGLVQGDDVHLPRLFLGDSGFEQDAVFGAHAAAHHDGHGGGQTQGAGTGDHKHRDGSGDREGKALAREQPHGQGEQGN